MIQSKSINHADYTLAERENLSATIKLDQSVPHVLLATCNRVEVYWGEGEIPDKLARHLFRVASGLESSLIGERAIQGQLKQAYVQAARNYSLSSSLNRLFQTAIHVGKRVRTETKIAEGAVSHSQVTVDMLGEYGIDLKNKIVGIIGINKLTENILKFLTARGAVNIYLSNRNIEKAVEMARKYNGTAMALDKKRDLLRFSHVLICATSAPHSLIHPADFPQDRGEILVFDLAFPRDVDQCVGDMPGITLYNIEDIEHFAKQTLSYRQNEVKSAEKIIEEEMAKLGKWQEVKKTLLIDSSFIKQTSEC
ncbi:glutamyl-tRNA reductase [Bacteroides neonati]|uniref:glutamyl-tRNA reductase n=1 Tax=Bacteroides neonati TaxID=1347393 RepID=UPI0004AF4EBB|nr:glutamyl-tRNA reductase [Bacteroides neonati]